MYLCYLHNLLPALFLPLANGADGRAAHLPRLLTTLKRQHSSIRVVSKYQFWDLRLANSVDNVLHLPR